MVTGVRNCLAPGKLRDANAAPICVFPGDPGIVYDISTGKFLCHKTAAFEDPKTLDFAIDRGRVLLFPVGQDSDRGAILDRFDELRQGRKLPYFKT